MKSKQCISIDDVRKVGALVQRCFDHLYCVLTDCVPCKRKKGGQYISLRKPERLQQVLGDNKRPLKKLRTMARHLTDNEPYRLNRPDLASKSSTVSTFYEVH